MLSLRSPELTTPKEFIELLASSDRPNRDLKIIEKAAHFAHKAHQDQKRVSGEPYISHPFAVAILVDELRLDTSSICGALLHDVLEDCEVPPEQIREEFDETIYNLVDGVTKLSKIQVSNKAELQAESLRKMLLAMTRDVRVILIKLCDRLHNMRTLEHMPQQKRVRIANETLDIYCPLAHRLGMSGVKWQLEDLCLKHSNPDAYYEILKRIAQKRKEREDFIEKVINELDLEIREAHLTAEISGRPKSFYSIYKKSQQNEKYMDEMYDLLAVRVITPTKESCYAILGLAHSIWTPLQQRFKDYIAVPKPNLYQSLHTTVIHSEGQMFEVQIRTQEMHETSEYGIAAHVLYKESETSKKQGAPEELNWLKQIVKWHSDIRDSQEFIENVRLDLFQHMVYAFTPNGQVIELRDGSTPIDFAYYIHTEVGNKCVGAKVENRVVPLSYKLRNGDIVKIITSKNSKGPNRDWLEIVKTKRAREGILAFLRKSSKEDYVAKGTKTIQQALEERIKRLPQDKKLSYREILNSSQFQKVVQAYGFRDITYLQEAVGKNEFRFETLISHLEIFKQEIIPKPIEELTSKTKAKKQKKDTVFVAGSPDMLVRMSRCCNPLYGDEILGFISRGRGVSIHRKDCPNAKVLIQTEPEREVEVEWDPASLLSKEASFLTQVQVETRNTPDVLQKVTTIISNFKLNICSLTARTKDSAGVLDLTLEVGNVGQLNNLIKNLSELEEVTSIYRVEPTKKKRSKKTKKSK
jgi:GTP diphosphokinase / guanosine-3',5'-bis(diphosphate) 3'-diphosphatase